MDQEYTRWKDDHDDAPRRPYRLWDAVARHDMPHRYYTHQQNALNGALLEAAWAKVGTSIEVYDCRTARHLATFTRRTAGQIQRWVKKENDDGIKERRNDNNHRRIKPAETPAPQLHAGAARRDSE